MIYKQLNPYPTIVCFADINPDTINVGQIYLKKTPHTLEGVDNRPPQRPYPSFGKMCFIVA